MKSKTHLQYAKAAGFVAYALFLLFSFLKGFEPGEKMAFDLRYFSLEMAKILPPAFILIGLFEVWVKKETIEKHFGSKSGLRGHIGGILLAGTTVGGLYVAFPVAYSLYRKGADLGVIFTYIAASAICRVPMTIFEASFLGIKFSIIRLAVSIPLVIVSSMLLGKYLTRSGYSIKEGE
ncbi:putative permease [bacterium BMS3Abin13]|nr:putative permease [bacterium BMS3Abin13]